MKIKFFSFSIVFIVLFLLSTREANAQAVNTQCIGQGLAKYMNAVISSTSGTPHIKFLSPVFNGTDTTNTPGIIAAMKFANANFSALDGVAVNSYYRDGKGAYQHYQETVQSLVNSIGKPAIFTEYGDYGGSNPVSDLTPDYNQIVGDPKILGALFFNGMGTNQTSFESFIVPPDQVQKIIQSNPSKAGANSANFITPNGEFADKMAFYGQPNITLGWKWALEILNGPGDLQAAQDAVNEANDRGLHPILRLCASGNTCAFSDTNILIQFIKDLNLKDPAKHLDGIHGDVWIVVGPNEPETEMWATPNCKTATPPQPFVPQEVPCTSGGPFSPSTTKDPEFHSLRPYPASPCYKQITQTALLCSNSLVAKNSYHFDSPTGNCVPNGDGSQTCTITRNSESVGVSINLANAKLPVLGNTEDVPNFTWTTPDTGTTNLTPAQRMNNYVSWYLNGVVSNAEQDLSNLNPDNLINFSGPLNKLLPQAIGFANRIASIQYAADTAAGNKDLKKDTTARHDQLVGCIGQGNNTLLLVPCYLKAGVNIIQQYLVLGGSNRKRLTNLAGNEPPKESDPKYANNFAAYWKDFLFWLGSTCSPNLGGTQFYLCLTAEFAAITSNNYAARIFPSIPSSTTEDRVGEIFTDKTITLKNGKNDLANTTQTNVEEVTNVSFAPTGGTLDPNCTDPSKCASHHNLYFSHTQEVAELAKNLQNTFATRSDINNNWEQQLQEDIAKNDLDQQAHLGAPSQNCEQVQTFTNPGDKLYGDLGEQNGSSDKEITGSLTFDTTFSCKFLPNPNYPACKATDPTCQPFKPCSHDVFVSMSLFSKTPNVQEDYDRLVNGEMGIFKRFYPKPGNGSIFASSSDIKDIPGVTTISYNANGGGADNNVSALAGDPNANRGGGEAQLFFPHLGSIEEYFLRGIQKALRPQGFDSVPLAGAASQPTGSPGPGQGAQCTTLSYTIPYQDASYIPKSVDEIIAILTDGNKTGDNAKNPGGFSLSLISRVKDSMNTVDPVSGKTRYQALIDASGNKFNPSFVLATWIEETAAGSIGGAQFGCGAAPMHDFNAQLGCFLGLVDYWKSNPALFSCGVSNGSIDFQHFMLFFSEGICSTITKNNGQFCTNPPFPGRLIKFYNLVKGSSSILQF